MQDEVARHPENVPIPHAAALIWTSTCPPTNTSSIWSTQRGMFVRISLHCLTNSYSVLQLWYRLRHGRLGDCTLTVAGKPSTNPGQLGQPPDRWQGAPVSRARDFPQLDIMSGISCPLRNPSSAYPRSSACLKKMWPLISNVALDFNHIWPARSPSSTLSENRERQRFS